MNTDERRAWGPLIRAARKSAGVYLEELETKSGVSRRTISDIERGNKVGQEDKIRALLRALGIPQPLELDADVKGFVAMLGPLLQRLGPDERARVMPAVVSLVAEELRPTTTGPTGVFPRPGAEGGEAETA